MSALDRKLVRELRAARGVLAAIVGIMVVGICCFVAMASLYLNLRESRDGYYAQARMADFWIDLKKMPLAELDRIRDLPGVAQVETRIVFPVTADLDGVERPLSGEVVSLPDRRSPVLNDIVLRSGRYFSDERRAETIVSDAFARARKLRPGDRIRLILDNRLQELSIVGTAIGPEYVYLLPPGGLVPDPEHYGVFYLKRSFAEEAFDFEGGCNQIIGRLGPEHRDRPAELLDRIERRLEPFGVAAVTPRAQQPSHWFLTSELEGLKINVVVLPAIFLSVAALILNVLMMRVAEQQRTIVGTLKAIGYGNGPLLRHYLKFGAAIGLAGGVLGGLSGYALAGLMTRVYLHYFEFPRLVNQPYPAVIAAGVGISAACALLGTLRGTRMVLRLAPAEAMRPKPPPEGRPILLERWRWLWRRLDFRWHLVLRGMFRQRTRTLAGVFAAAVGAALILLMLSLRDSMDALVQFQFDKLLLSDFDVTLKDPHDLGAAAEAARLPGVDHAEPLFTVPCTFRHGPRSRKGAITGIVPGARLTIPRDAAGNRVPVPEVGVMLTARLAELLDAAPGDVLRVEPVTGDREPRSVPVARVADSYLGLAAYADFGYLNRLMGEEGSVTGLQLAADPSPESARAFYREIKRTPAVQTVNPIREQKAQLEAVLVEQTMIAIYVVIAFAGLMFFGSILNSSLIGLAERRREIATFRVLGYRPREVGAIFLRESLIVNLAGTLLGLPLGVWLTRLLSRLYDTDLYRIPFVIRPESLIVTVLLGVAFILLAHVPVRAAVRRLDWLDALNVRE
ncbi:MAG: FtsX-like permease family protein [Planctomycetales bacterium]